MTNINLLFKGGVQYSVGSCFGSQCGCLGSIGGYHGLMFINGGRADDCRGVQIWLAPQSASPLAKP